VVGFTVGQRKGIGVGGGVTENNAPLYVIKVDADKAEVIVGPREALACDIVHIKQCNWLVETQKPLDVTVKLRSVSQPLPARLIFGDAGAATLTLEAPQFGISPGQAAVCYAGDRVLGGGWIEKASSLHTGS
jgi:tRNA-uridine 2-sulfurtransferase